MVDFWNVWNGLRNPIQDAVIDSKIHICFVSGIMFVLFQDWECILARVSADVWKIEILKISETIWAFGDSECTGMGSKWALTTFPAPQTAKSTI